MSVLLLAIFMPIYILIGGYPAAALRHIFGVNIDAVGFLFWSTVAVLAPLLPAFLEEKGVSDS